AARSDVAEELARLGSHLDQFRALLRDGGAIGRQFDFLAQELHREVNTIASKADDAELVARVLEARTLVERIREQVQNVETAAASRRGMLIVVSAPSGAGKTTLCRDIRKTVANLAYSVSYTTRNPRPGEMEGQAYHFVSELTFQQMVDRGEFAEWARVHGHLYGTAARTL